MGDSASSNRVVLPRNATLNLDMFSHGEIERALMRHQLDVTILSDNESRVHYISPSVEVIFGFTADDVRGRTFAEFVVEEDFSVVAENWLKHINGPRGDPLTFRVRHKEGHLIWCEARSSQILSGAFEEFNCINIREVEHQHRLRERIAAAEELAKIGTWKWIISDDKPHWSISHYTMLGYKPQDGDLDLEWALSLIHPEDAIKAQELILQNLENPGTFSIPVRMRAANGEYRTIMNHCYAENDGHGKMTAMIGLCQDITEKVEADKKLRESERFYRALAEEASDFITRFDRDGKFVFASEAGHKILGYETQEILDRDVLSVIYEEDQPLILGVYDKLTNGSESERVSYRAVHKSGSLIWLEASARAIRDQNGDLNEVIVIARDITERQNYEARLKEAIDKAETANQTKSKLLANVSHELRTPLNAIIGFTDIMREEMFGPIGSDQYKDYIRLVHESGQFLLDLINDILDISKIEAGKYELTIEDVNLFDIANTCRQVVEQRARENGVTLELDLDPTITTIQADQRAIKQMLLNLLSNGVKFTEPGGRVTVQSRRVPEGIRICVCDTGIGIPAEALPRLGQPFEQATNDATQAQQGTGLGLALVKSFAELHGGKLSIESEEGEGTRVAFTLPLSVNRRKGERRDEEDRRKSA